MDFEGLAFGLEHVRRVCEQQDWTLDGCSLIGSGANSVIIELDTDRGAFVLKVSNNDHYDHLENEAERLELVGGRFGPELVAFDGSKELLPETYVVMERLYGEHPTGSVDDAFVRSMARWYRQLHSMVEPSEKLRLTTFSDDYELPRRLSNDRSVPDHLRERFISLARSSLDLIEHHDGVFDGLEERCLIQGDPSPENFFLSDPVKLIDWEFSRFSVPEEDLTFFAHTFKLDENALQILFDAYGYPAENRLRFDLMMLLQIWGMIGWRLDRLDVIERTGIRAHQKRMDPEQMRSGIEEGLDDVETILVAIEERYANSGS